jgi:hypothetical protein
VTAVNDTPTLILNCITVTYAIEGSSLHLPLLSLIKMQIPLTLTKPLLNNHSVISNADYSLIENISLNHIRVSMAVANFIYTIENFEITNTTLG